MPWFQQLRDVLSVIRAPLLVLVLTYVALFVPAQTRDMLAAIDETPGEWGFQFAMAVLAGFAWFWSRAAISASTTGQTEDNRRQPLPPLPVDGWHLWAPRLMLLLAVIAPMVLEALDASLRDLAITLCWAIPLAVFVALRMPIWRALVREGWLTPRPSCPQIMTGDNLSVVRKLVFHAPFHDGFTWGLLGLGLVLFALGAAESFGAISFGSYGLAASLSVAFPGPATAVLTLALMIGPLTNLTMLALANPLPLPGGGRVSVPVLTLLALWVFLLAGAVSPVAMHVVRIVPGAYEPAGPPRPTLASMFQQWQSACASGTDPLHPVVVSISGGASMAGVWGASVLSAVDGALPRPQPAAAHSCIFAISSVSGGSLGAAAFEAAATEAPRPGCGVASLRTRRLHRDALGPVLGGMGFADAPRAMLVWITWLPWWPEDQRPAAGDRAAALEHGFERIWGSAQPEGCAPQNVFAEPYLKLFSPTVFEPIWIANGTSVTAGGRIITAPFASKVSGSPGDEVWPFHPASDALALLGADVPVSTAINNSARFTYLEPAGQLAPAAPGVERKPAQIIDGGYFENEGVLTALELIAWLKTYGPGIAHRPVQPILVQATASGAQGVTADQVVRCWGGPSDDPTAKLPKGPTTQLLAPLLGLYNARGAHSAVLLRDARAQLCGDEQYPRLFHFMLAGTKDGSIPLNWILSDVTASLIWAAIDDDVSGNGLEHQRLDATLTAFNAKRSAAAAPAARP
ncbi:MAG TPA: hypothetical protein VJY39_15950 [Acidisphaera sp.]|nr:hypothetical protein [Acidisphaera sp.]